MHSYYYGVQTVLAYVLNHFFYDAVHYTYLAREYYPYRRKNPRSSSPHRIYEDLYELWRDKDEFNKFGIGTRANIKTGVIAQESRSVIDSALAKRLGYVCDQIDVGVFYPIVYRVDIKTIDRKRLRHAGSGLLGSYEYLIPDLHETEINDILFLDDERDAIMRLVKYEYEHFRSNSRYGTNPSDVLILLEERVRKHVRIRTTKTRTGPSSP